VQNLESAQDLAEDVLDTQLLNNNFNNLASKTIVECATAMAVAKEGINKEI